MKLRVLIADDEKLARERLRALLDTEPGIEIIGACDNGRDALKIARSDSPDLIFLDVQMPELDGFAFLESLPVPRRPLIIIVTGHEKYAARAFEIHAVDFLLKPFDRERLRKTLQRARERMEDARQSDIREVLSGFNRRLNSSPKPAERIPIKDNGRIILLKSEEIDWIGAAGNYAEVHLGQSSHLLLSTLDALEARLASAKFVRISRSTIINASRLQEVRFHARGRCTVVLQDSTELAVSPTHRRKLDQFLGR